MIYHEDSNEFAPFSTSKPGCREQGGLLNSLSTTLGGNGHVIVYDKGNTLS